MKDAAVVFPGLRAGLRQQRFAAALVAPLLVLGLSHLLPSTGAGAGIRIAAAAAVVLLVPGLVVMRALGWPAQLGVVFAGALAWSLTALFLAMVVTFAVGGSLTLTLALVAVTTLVACVPAFKRPEPRIERADAFAVLGTIAVALPLAAVAWLVHRTVIRDALFHIAYARKLDEVARLESLDVVGHFADGGLHPGYAFPLWHGALASIARLSGVDPSEVVLRLGPVLTPLALVVAYGAGVAVFRSVWGGLASVATHGALWGFGAVGLGLFISLSDPATAARGLLATGLLALVFVYAVEGGRGMLLSVAAAALVLAIVHPNYAPYTALVLFGCLIARWLIVRRRSAASFRVAVAIGITLLTSGLFILWLWPIVSETSSFNPDTATTVRDMTHFAGFFVGTPESFRLEEGVITRRGGLFVGALLAVPLAAFAGRRLWAAFVLGGSLIVLVILLTPFLFTAFADLASLSQARRLTGFLPVGFALAGASVIVGRLRLAGAVGALGAGVALSWLYSGESSYRIGQLGPGWPVWVTIVGAAAALGCAAWKRPLGPEPRPWAAAVAAAFVLPFVVAAVPTLEREPRDAFALSAGLVAAIRENVDSREVMMSKPETSYRISAEAPVNIVSMPISHAGDTRTANPRGRLRDTARFFAPDTSVAERRSILEAYGAAWLVLDKRRSYPREFDALVRRLETVYEDGRYVLLRTEAG